MPLLFEEIRNVGEGLKGFQALVDELFPFCYLAAVGLVAEFAQGDLAFLDADESQVFRCINDWEKLIEIDTKVNGEIRNVRLAVVGFEKIEKAEDTVYSSGWKQSSYEGR